VPIKDKNKSKPEYAVNWVCSNFYNNWQADLKNIEDALIKGTDNADGDDKVKWLNTLIFIDQIIKGQPVYNHMKGLTPQCKVLWCNKIYRSFLSFAIKRDNSTRTRQS
jgi:hypothetical protein